MNINDKLRRAPKVFITVLGRDETFHVQISKKEANRLFDTASATQFHVIVLDSAGTVLIEKRAGVA